jgi:hypothetical protein
MEEENLKHEMENKETKKLYKVDPKSGEPIK